MDENGREFFATGRGAVETLEHLAGALRGRDLAAAEAFYSPGFRGSPLGLAGFRQTGEKDGVETAAFAARPGEVGRDAALDEWRAHLHSLPSIQGVRPPPPPGGGREAPRRGTPQGPPQ